MWTNTRDLDLPLGVLSWGHHTIQVQAKLGAGPWSTATTHAFQVLRPFWATWPFLLGLGMVGTAAGCGAYRVDRHRRKIERRVLPDLIGLRAEAFVPEAHALLQTALAGRFLPIRVLARGGFATVFAGLDKEQNRRCAIKVFHREVADLGLAQRFAQEVAALETVIHPNVVRIYGHGETPSGVPYLVMEFIEGKTLRDAIPPEGFPAREVASLLRQAGQALAAIHAHGICHRDLKPENLMIRQRELVLIDFSIAIVKSPDQTVHGLSRAAGTIQYMAPEQAVGWADAASDLYSLAKVVIEMMTGKRLSELLPQASRDLSQRVREFLPHLPLHLSPESVDLIGRALEFDPERRPRDAVAFAERIAADLEIQS
jgi:serine/threonine protein kinase